jgi:superfamily I DNA/RNA helicase
MLAQIEAGADPRSLAFVSFTRVACDVARERLCDRTGLLPEELPYCATIHALARRALGISGRDWCQDSRLREFAREYDYDLLPARGGPDDEDLDDLAGGGGEDAPLLAVWNWGRARQIHDPEAALRAYADYDPEGCDRLDYRRYRQLVQDWEEDKRANGRRDFTDLLEQVAAQGLSLPVSAVAIDEAQDQSPLLWAAAEALFADAPASAILADENQAIMSFQGAAPELFTARQAQELVPLEQSYRLPRRVAALAEQVIRRNPGQASRRIIPREEEGRVAAVDNLNELDFACGGTWMVLVRNWRFAARVMSHLESRGIPYRVAGGRMYSPWDEKGPRRAAEALVRLSAGGEITLAEALLLAERTRVEMAGRPGMWVYGSKAKLERMATADPAGRVSLAELYQVGLTPAGVRQILARDLRALVEISSRDRDAYRAALDAGRWGQAPQVTVGSIHSVKGDEADQVALLQDAGRLSARSLDDPARCAEEYRCMYVAVTRARHEFHAVAHSDGQPWELPARIN